MREKEGYRENMGMILELFPGRVSITPKEAATIMDVNVKTIYSAISRVKNPLPAVSMSAKKIIIPIAAFARWLS